MEFAEAKRMLVENNLTCVIFGDEIVYTSSERGIRPLLRLIDEKKDYTKLCAVDKVIGKAAAFAYVILKIQKVHAFVISESAKKVLEKHKIVVTYDTLVEYIRNRAGNGRCPMESAVWDIESSEEALFAIRRKLDKLQVGDKG